MNQKTYETKFGGKSLKVETGLAPQSNAAFKVTYGETVVLVTAVLNKNLREGVNFLPLTVEYEEKFYAAGRIKGSRFIKREGRASDEAILSGRVIDRIIRPRFNQLIRNEIQVVATVFSFDGENDPDIPAVIGASLALGVSDIPWDGPMTAIRIAKTSEGLIINPNYDQRDNAKFDLTVASDGNLINMIELGSVGVDNEEILQAIKAIKKELQDNIVFQKKIISELGVKKQELILAELDKATALKADKFLNERLGKAIENKIKPDFKEELNKIKEDYSNTFGDLVEKAENSSLFKDALDMFFEKKIDDLVHQNIIQKESRPDGRKTDEIRELSCEVGILPRTHGSGLFRRGLTHVLSVVTLATPGEEQLLDGMEIVGTKSFMHHYNFPPYSVGETGFFRGPGRREIGHGALAEKAVKPILPTKEGFPYTVRIVSEVLSSNGSSSMASVCGSVLALQDAGVPIKEAVSGIAMGLMSDGKGNYKILTDIQGPEDHYGDMDLKVAGTKEKVTALQMDVKIEGISEEILENALKQAQKARQQILEAMRQAISAPREQISQYAPKVAVIKIDKAKIGEVIGGGGRTINGIIEKTNTTIDIKDDGQIFVSGLDQEKVNQAVKIIEEMVKEYEPGEVAEGTISRILDFGAFVRLSPVHEGMIHISKLAPHHVDNVKNIVIEGDKVKVEVVNVDEMGRINLKLVKNYSREPSSGFLKQEDRPKKRPFGGARRREFRKRPYRR